MSGIQAQKPVDIAKQKVDNVKNYEGNMNGVIDTRDEIKSLSIFLEDNRSSLSTDQIDYLEKNIKQGEEAVAKQEAKVAKQQKQETARQLGDLGKRIEELSDENGYVTKGGATELAAMLGKGILTEFQENYVKDLLVKSGFESMLKPEDPVAPPVNVQPEVPVAQKADEPKAGVKEDSVNVPHGKSTDNAKNLDAGKKADKKPAAPKAKSTTPSTPHNVKIKEEDYNMGKHDASMVDFLLCSRYQTDANKANSVAAFLGVVNQNTAYGFFKNFTGNYCYRTMIALRDPNNNIRFDVISKPIKALMVQAAAAGLQKTEEYKALAKSLDETQKVVAQNSKDTRSNIKAGDFGIYQANDLDYAINRLTKLMEKYVIIEKY